MATPTFGQYAAPSSSGPGLNPETVADRITTLLAVLASGQNPDGTATGTATITPVPNLIINTPTDTGVSNRQAIEAWVAQYGTAVLPAGNIVVDRAILLTKAGTGLQGSFPVPNMTGSPTNNNVESRLVPSTQAGALTYASNAANAVASVRTDASCTFTAGSTTLTDAALASTDLGRQVINSAVPPGTYLTSVSAGVSGVMSNPATLITITSASTTGNPTTITAPITTISNGDSVVIAGATGGSAVINGTNTVSAVSINFTTGVATFTIPVNNTNALTGPATLYDTSAGIGPSVWYSVVQLGDDNIGVGNWVNHLTIDAGTTAPSAILNATARGTIERCMLNGGTSWCLDNSAVGGNSVQGSGPGVDMRMLYTDTDNSANYKANPPGGNFRIQGGVCEIYGGKHAHGIKNLHGSELLVQGGYWNLDDNTAAPAKPHVDIFINVTFRGVTFSGIQNVAMFRRNTRGAATAPVTVQFEGCDFIASGAGTHNLPMITDLQPPGSQFDPISINGGRIMSFGQSNNSAGVSPFSTIIDDARALVVNHLRVDGGAIGQFNINAATTYSATTATDTSAAYTVNGLTNCRVTSIGTGGNFTRLVVTSNTATVITGSGGWTNGTPASNAYFYIEQFPTPTKANLYNGTNNTPIRQTAVIYQITYTATPSNAVVTDI